MYCDHDSREHMMNTNFQYPAVILAAAHLKEGERENCFALGKGGRSHTRWDRVSHTLCLHPLRCVFVIIAFIFKSMK